MAQRHDEQTTTWLDDATRAALSAILPPHVSKKQVTVALVAFALENDTNLSTVFDRPDTCARSIWYEKWSLLPDIAAALSACRSRVRVWRTERTIITEAYYTEERRRKIAKHAASAPDALAAVMLDNAQRGGDRINAASKLISLADPDTAERVSLNQPGAANIETTQSVHVDTDRIADILSILKDAGALEPDLDAAGVGDDAQTDGLHPAPADG